jgi:DNA-binding response OmpR family regulator
MGGVVALEESYSVLLVEDEVLIVELARDMLEQAGYRVDVAVSGFEAVERIAQRGSHVAALVTDIRLGDGPDGWDIARVARLARPDLPVIYMTADSAGEWPTRGVPGSVVLQKPFTMAELVLTFETMLGCSRNAAHLRGAQTASASLRSLI